MWQFPPSAFFQVLAEAACLRIPIQEAWRHVKSSSRSVFSAGICTRLRTRGFERSLQSMSFDVNDCNCSSRRCQEMIQALQSIDSDHSRDPSRNAEKKLTKQNAGALQLTKAVLSFCFLREPKLQGQRRAKARCAFPNLVPSMEGSSGTVLRRQLTQQSME